MATPITIRVEVIAERAQRALDRTARSAEKVGDAWSRTSTRFLAASGVVHATTVTQGLVSAVVAASGSLLALPAAGAMAGAALATLKVGTFGVSDAFGALGEDQEKFNEAIKNLAPEAQSFMRNLRGMRGEADALRDSVQGELFAGLTGQTTRLADQYLPLLTTGMTRVAGSMNRIVKAAAGVVSTPFFKGTVARVFRQTARAGDAFAGAVRPLGTVLAALVRAGGPYIGQLVRMTTAWVKTTVAARSAGQWVQFFRGKIERGLEILRGFGRSLQNVRQGLSNLFGDRKITPEALVGSIERLSAAFLRWTRNAENVRNVNQILDALAKILPALVGPARVLGRVLGTVARWFNNLPAPVQEFIVQAVAMGLILGKVLKVLGPLFRFLGKVGGVIGRLAGFVSKVVARFGGWRVVLGTAGKTLIRFLGPIGLVITAVLAVISAVRNWDKIKAIAARVWNTVKAKTAEAWNAIQAKVAGAAASAKQKMADAWDNMVATVKRKGGEAIEWVKSLPGKAADALSNLGSTLVNAGSSLIQGLIDGIQSKIGDVQSKLSELTNLLPDWKGPRERDRKLLRPAGRLIIEGLIAGFEDGTAGVKKSLEKVTKRIERALDKRYDGKGLKRHFRDVKAALADEFRAIRRNGREQDRMNERLKKARDLVKEARQAYRDYAAQVAEAARSAAGVTANETAFNADAIAAGMQNQLGKLTMFARLIEQLRRQGLNQQTLDELVQGGVEGGLAYAKAIADGGKDAVTQINSLQKQIANVAGGLGQSAAKNMHQAGVNSAEAMVRGLERKSARLEKAARRLARRIAVAVQRALVQEGLDFGGTREPSAKNALVRQQKRRERDRRVPLSLHLSADTVSQLQRGRAIQRDLDAYRKAGGRAAG